MRILFPKRFKGRKRKGDLVEGFVNGKKKSFRKTKVLPKGCKTAKRLCIMCFKKIHKQNLNYEYKICDSCDPSYRASLGCSSKSKAFDRAKK